MQTVNTVFTFRVVPILRSGETKLGIVEQQTVNVVESREFSSVEGQLLFSLLL